LFAILTDIRYSARKFARAPSLTFALLLTIALGVGSNVSVHRFVLGLTKPDSPLASVHGIVSVFREGEHRSAGPLSYGEYQSLQSRLDALEWIAAARISPETVSLAGHSPIESVAAVTPRLAELLDLSLKDGIVISQSIRQREFRATDAVRGEPVRIGGADLRIAGVAPDWLEGLYRDRPVDLWIPLTDATLQSVDPTTRNLWVVARLRPGVSIHHVADPAWMRVVPYTGMTPEVADGLSRVGTLLGIAAGLVFFIACANVASFLAGRASARSQETSVRVALGGGRAQLARGLLADSIVISVAGGALGALLAVWTSYVLPALLFESDAERLVSSPDVFGIVAASAVCVAITIACGLLPVFTISHDRPAMVLRRESAGPSKALQRVRLSLVVAQMTSCCILVIATAFLFEALHTALQTSVGRRLGHPILAGVVTANPYGSTRYFEEVQSAAASVGGVLPMAWMAKLPGALPQWRSFRIDPQQLPLREVALDMAPFSTDLFARFAMQPAAGRLFSAADGTCRTAVANPEAAAELLGAATVGRSIRSPAGLPIEIIGVLARRGEPQARSRPTIYYYDANGTQAPTDRIASAHFRAPSKERIQTAELDVNVVSPSYFVTMGVPRVAGRTFPDDSAARGCRTGVINEEAADLYFGGKAVGAAVIDESGRRTEIIGVVHSTPLGTFEPRAEPAIYFPTVQDCPRGMTLILGAGDVNGPLIAKLTSIIEGVPGRGPAPVLVRTLEGYLGQTALAPLRIATMIIGASATTAFILSALGLFGALSDAARQRRRELAVRIALGAQRRHVIFQVLREGGRLACAGALGGTLGSLLLSRILTRIAPGNRSPALWVWLAAPVVLAGAVAIASILPARRALNVNPLEILRDQN
jgi:putative ABC transport system permease protein